MTFNRLIHEDSLEPGCKKHDTERIMAEDPVAGKGRSGYMNPELYLYTTENTRRGSNVSMEAKCVVDPKLHYDREDSVGDSICLSMIPGPPFLGNETESAENTSQQKTFSGITGYQMPKSPADHMSAWNWQSRSCSWLNSQSSMESDVSQTEQTMTQSDPHGHATRRGLMLVDVSLEETLALSDPINSSVMFLCPNHGNNKSFPSRDTPMNANGCDRSLIGGMNNLSVASNNRHLSGDSQSGISVGLSKLTLTTDASFDNTTVTKDVNHVPNWMTEPETQDNFYMGRNGNANSRRQPVIIPIEDQESISSGCLANSYVPTGVKIHDVDDGRPGITPERTMQQDYDGDTMLHNAIIHELMTVVMTILSKIPYHSVLNIANNLKQTPLHLAVLVRQPPLVRALLSRGSNVDARDSRGNTPLHLACRRGYVDIVRELTKPLHHSEKVNCVYQVPFQRVPQDPSILNYDGQSCVHLAASSGNLGALEYLLTADIGHSVNAQHGCTGRTVLHEAISQNNVNLVTYLLKNSESLNVNVNCKAFDGTTPLVLASGNPTMTNALRQFGAMGHESMQL